METGIYIRVSTEEQAQEGYSIRGQEEKLKDYSRIKDWSIIDIYIDEGISGKNIKDRPAANRLIEDVKAGRVKNVLVYKIDRLTRSTADLVYLVDLFNQYDCAFNSLMESIDTQTPSGRMFLKIIGIFAEFERENIIERVKMGRDRKVKEGYSLCSSHASYGYDREPGIKIQTINETEAAIVMEIFDMYVNQNMSMIGIVRLLNLRKVPTKKDKLWDRKNLKNILTNSSYIGKVRHFIDDKENYSEANGLHESIISKELFEKAQQLIKKNPDVTRTKKPLDRNYYLGLLYCSECGAKISTHNRADQCSYRCTNHAVGGGCAVKEEISHKKMDTAFREYILSIADFDVADEIKIEQQEQQRHDCLELVGQYNEKLRQIEKKCCEIMDLYIDNAIDFDSYKDMKSKLDKDKEILYTELRKLEQEDNSETLINKDDIILNFTENWDLLTNGERRRFLLRFVKRIVIVNERQGESRKNTAWVKEVEFEEC